MLASRLLWLRRLSVLCVALTVVLMGLGAWVKANSAGGACPDWPACYGRLLPPFPSQENGELYHGAPVGYTEAQDLYEWTHRAVVSLLFVPVAAFAIVAIATREANRPLRQLAAAGLALYIFQAGLGGVTVTLNPGGEPPAWAATAHLVTATVFLVTLTVAACFAHLKPLGEPAPAAEAPPKPRVVSFVYPDEPAGAPEAEAPDA
jgi:heme A synthase